MKKGNAVAPPGVDSGRSFLGNRYASVKSRRLAYVYYYEYYSERACAGQKGARNKVPLERVKHITVAINRLV